MKQTRKLLSLLLTLAMLLSILAPTALAEGDGKPVPQYTISGTVAKNASIGEDATASISLYFNGSTLAETTADSDGHYSLTTNQAGLYLIDLSLTGKGAVSYSFPLCVYTDLTGVDLDIDNTPAKVMALSFRSRENTPVAKGSHGIFNVNISGIGNFVSINPEYGAYIPVDISWTLTGNLNSNTYLTAESDASRPSGPVTTTGGGPVTLVVDAEETAQTCTITATYTDKENPSSPISATHTVDITDGTFHDSFSEVDSIKWYYTAFTPGGSDQATYATITNLERLYPSFSGQTWIPEAFGDDSSTIPVTEIGKNACQNIPYLTNITLPETLAVVGAGSFDGCTNLTKVRFENSNVTIGDGAFANCNAALTLVGETGSPVEQYATDNGLRFRDIDDWQYYSFANAHSDFFSASDKTYHYPLTDSDWRIMFGNNIALYGRVGASYTANLRNQASQAWGGSCYGIAVLEGLYNKGLISERTHPWEPSETPFPKDNQSVRSMVNFYFLTQLLPDFQNTLHYGCKQEGDYIYPYQRVNWTNDLTALRATLETGPVLFCYYFVSNGSLAGHAIIIEGIKETNGNMVTLIGRDNRFPGKDGTGVTDIVVDLTANGTMTLKYPTPYSGNEDILMFSYTNDFDEYLEKMPLDRAPSIAESSPSSQYVEVEGIQNWTMTAGTETFTASGGAKDADDELKIPAGNSSSSISLRNLLVASTVDNGTVINTPAPLIYTVDESVDSITFTPTPEPTQARSGKTPFTVSFTTSEGFASVTADSADRATLQNNGKLEVNNATGEVKLATVAGDGSLIQVAAANVAASATPITLTPTANGSTLTAPKGDYQVTVAKDDGTTSNTTAKIATDGGTAAITVPKTTSSSGGGGGATAYTITATAGTGGTISPSGKTSVQRNADQTFTITPQTGYVIDKVLVDDKSVGAVATYTFEKVSKSHTIQASFVKSDTSNNPFTDIVQGAYYTDGVLWAVEKGVTTGTTANTFSPAQDCTRAQIVTFLYRAMGQPTPTQTSNPFTDVNQGDYYYNAVLWAVEQGITAGTTANTFSPSDPCTRAQAVTFLHRAMGQPSPTQTGNPFSDVATGTYYANAVLWAVEKGVTTGTTATTFAPDDTCTRGQIVTFLYRAMG